MPRPLIDAQHNSWASMDLEGKYGTEDDEPTSSRCKRIAVPAGRGPHRQSSESTALSSTDRRDDRVRVVIRQNVRSRRQGGSSPSDVIECRRVLVDQI